MAATRDRAHVLRPPPLPSPGPPAPPRRGWRRSGIPFPVPVQTPLSPGTPPDLHSRGPGRRRRSQSGPGRAGPCDCPLEWVGTRPQVFFQRPGSAARSSCSRPAHASCLPLIPHTCFSNCVLGPFCDQIFRPPVGQSNPHPQAVITVIQYATYPANPTKDLEHTRCHPSPPTTPGPGAAPGRRQRPRGVSLPVRAPGVRGPAQGSAVGARHPHAPLSPPPHHLLIRNLGSKTGSQSPPFFHGLPIRQ